MRFVLRWFRKHPHAKVKSRPERARPQLEVLEDRQVPTVQFFGGNVLSHVQAQALFLGSSWSSGASASLTGTVNAYLKDVTNSAYMDALTQAGYGVGRGSAVAGALDNVLLPANSVINDSSIQSKIQTDINNGLLQTPNSNTLYIVYVQPNVAVNLGFGQGTTQQGILGYHGAFGGQTASGVPETIRYAVIAYPGGTVGNSSLNTTAINQLTAVTSHELAEAVTDPDVNYAQLGWYDPQRGEIGDMTENNPNALVWLDGYLVQEVAGKNDQLLALPTTPITPPTPTPPAPTPPTPPTTPVSTVATTTTLTAKVNRTHWWQPPSVTFTVTITPASGQLLPDGQVELLADGQVLGTASVQVVNGVATATFTVQFFGSGNYNFTASYLGSSSFQGSTSNSVGVTVY